MNNHITRFTNKTNTYIDEYKSIKHLLENEHRVMKIIKPFIKNGVLLYRLPPKFYFFLLELYLQNKLSNINLYPSIVVSDLIASHQEKPIKYLDLNFNSIGYFTWKEIVFPSCEIFYSSEWNYKKVDKKYISNSNNLIANLFDRIFSSSHIDFIKSVNNIRPICEAIDYSIISYPSKAYSSDGYNVIINPKQKNFYSYDDDGFQNFEFGNESVKITIKYLTPFLKNQNISITVNKDMFSFDTRLFSCDKCNVLFDFLFKKQRITLLYFKLIHRIQAKKPHKRKEISLKYLLDNI